jgi:hypothetical protein
MEYLFEKLRCKVQEARHVVLQGSEVVLFEGVRWRVYIPFPGLPQGQCKENFTYYERKTLFLVDKMECTR